MEIRIASRRFAAALTMLVAGAASAQPAPSIEVDFTSGFVPLSPTLSIAIAIAVAVIGGVFLRRARIRSRLLTWAIAAILGVPVLGGLYNLKLIGDAQAIIPQQPLALVTSPATAVLTNPNAEIVLVTNSTSGPIAITRILLLNPGTEVIIGPPSTTCSVGMRLDPGGSCQILVEAQS